MRDKELFKRMAANSKEHNIHCLIEEMAELTQALTKELRGKPNRDNLAEEISDVMMMLEVTTRCLDVSLDDIEKWSIKKQQALHDWYFVQGKGEKYEDSGENER